MNPDSELSTTLTTNCNAVTFRFKGKTSDDKKKKKGKKRVKRRKPRKKSKK